MHGLVRAATKMHRVLDVLVVDRKGQDMQVQAHYDPVQDRILLRLVGVSAAGEVALWLTRRHWTQIAVACHRARTAAEADVASRLNPPEGAVKARRSAPAEQQTALSNARLVAGVRFRRTPGGLRLEFATDTSAPVALSVKGRGLVSLADLVDRLARQARWDLDAALTRITEASASAPTRLLH